MVVSFRVEHHSLQKKRLVLGENFSLEDLGSADGLLSTFLSLAEISHSKAGTAE